MVFFDLILERLNSDVVDSFNDVFNEYRGAIETLIAQHTIYSEANLAFITEKATRDRITESYKSIRDRLHSLFKGKLPQRYSYAQKKFVVDNIETINDIYTLFNEERILADDVAYLKKHYPHAFGNYCRNNGLTPSKLSKVDKRKVLSNKSILAKDEALIIAQIQHDKLVSDFNKNIVDKYPRRSYYKKFHKDTSSDEGMKYFLSHLNELDAFCKYQIDVVPYEALAHYADDFLISQNKRIDDYVYLMSSSTISQFHKFATKKIEDEYKPLESTYPIGTKYFIESINSRCLWPRSYTPVIYTYILRKGLPSKSQWEIEQEQRELDEFERKVAIEHTIHYICIRNKAEIEKLQNLYSKVEEIKSSCPDGSKLLIEKNPITSDANPSTIAQTSIVDIGSAPIKGKSYVNYYTKFVQAENIIRRLQSLYEWQQKQLDFCKFVRKLRDELKLPWGCYSYEFPFRGEIYDAVSSFKTPDVNFKVWQFFIESFSSADLDYTLCPKYSLESVDNESLKSGRTTFRTWVYDKIKDFIVSLKFDDYSPVVVFADTDDRWEIYHKSSHFLYLRSILQDNAIPEFERFGYILNQDSSKKIIVVVDLITSNYQLKSFASDIIGGINDANLIVYISLRKEYSKEEMQSIIDAEQKKIDDKKAAEEAERLKRIQEQERIKREAEQKRLADERKHREIHDLKECVSSWGCPTRSAVRCFSLYNYYPTTCSWNASEEEWDIRNLVWDFKANPNKPQSETEIRNRHSRAVNKILPDLTYLLDKFFGYQKSRLTLVCIPSSKRIVTERRYKDFSERVCSETGMTNGYHYVHIAEEGEAAHLGGVVQAQFYVDSSFFKDKYVMLFDDVITSGKSMEKIKRLLESAGATVIGGLSIGRTKHERQCNNPIDTI